LRLSEVPLGSFAFTLGSSEAAADAARAAAKRMIRTIADACHMFFMPTSQ
jgi:hypothetical protein